jgi:hypothetical protein
MSVLAERMQFPDGIMRQMDVEYPIIDTEISP